MFFQTSQISFHNHGAKKKRKATNFTIANLSTGEIQMRAKHRGEKIAFHKKRF